MPFVGINKPSILPFIGRKIPFVCYKGFSIVELIIVLTIAGILVALAAPGMQKFVSSNRLTSQTNDLLADINLSRSEAIKRNTATGVCVTASGGSSCVATGNWANGWLVYYVDSTSTKVTVKVHEALVGNNTLTAPADEITYSKNGLAASGTGQFTLTDPKAGSNRIICIGTTGRPILSAATCT